MKKIFQTHPSRLLLSLLFAIIGGGINAWGETVTFTTAYSNSTHSVTKTSGDLPDGATFSFTGTYTNATQMTAGKSQTLTLSGFNGYTITNITLSMKSNVSSGAGVLAYSTNGGTTYSFLVGSSTTNNTSNITGVAFSDAAWNGAYTGTYTNISKDVNIEVSSSDVCIYVRATSNSLYCQSYSITYQPSASSSAVATTTTIDDSGITNTDVYASTAAGSLSATVTETESGNAVSGASVTWSGNNDAVATIDASTGAVTLVAAGTVTFTAQYAGVQDEYKASSDTYEMTVTSSAPYVQPTEFDIALNNTLFGTSYSGSVSGLTDANPVSGTLNGVTVTYAGSGNHYINDSQIRFYPSNKLTFEAPDGYNITEIVFTSAGTWAATISTEEGTYTSDTKTWEGEATTVLFTGSGSSRCDMSKAAITLEAIVPKVLSSIALSGDYPTTFHTGDAFSHEGMTVTATYEGGKTADVTASATFSGYNMGETGEQTVTVSYTESEVTKTATYTITVSAPATLTGITLSGTYPTEFEQGDAFSSTGIVVTANYDDNTTADVTAEAAFSGYDMDVLGNQTVTVTYGGQTASYTITVVEKSGTLTKPYTVEEAIAATPASGTSANVYIHGYVSAFYDSNDDILDDSYHRYYISDDGTTENQLVVYKGAGLNNETFTSADDLKVGDEVIIYGKLTTYEDAPEVASGNYLVSLVRNLTLIFDTVTNGSVAVQVNGIAQTPNVDGEVIVASGSTVTLTATADDGYTFSKWTCTDDTWNNNTENPLVFTMPLDDVEFGAEFVDASIKYDIIVDDAVVGGTIEADVEEAKADDVVTLTATPSSGYVFGSWDVQDDNDNSIEVNDNNQFTMPASDVTVTATFLPVYTVTYYVGGEEHITTRVSGEALNLDAPSSAFAGWSTANDADAPEFIANDAAVTSDLTLYAIFLGENSTYDYELVETNQADWSGDYLIAYDDETFADGREGGANGIGAQNTSVDPGDKLSGKVVDLDWGDIYNVTIEAIDASDLSQGYVLKTKDGKYNYQTSNANGVQSTENKETAANYPLSITFNSSSDIEIAISAGAVFHYNTQGYFRFYKNGGQSAVYLYKRTTTASYSLDVHESVTVTDAGYATYCSDKALDFEGTGITAYYGTAEGTKLTFKPVTKVPANTGVLLVCAGGKTVDVPALSGAADAVTGNILTGVTEATTLEADDYILNVVGGQAGFFKAGNDHKNLKANRAYIPASVGAGVKSFALDLEDNADGIEETLSDSLLKSENIYNLAGQRLSKMQKGINIVNGKKVLK